MTGAAAAPPRAAAEEPRPVPGRGIKPLLSWKAHWRVSAVVAAVVVVLGIPYAWVKGKVLWSSSASIRISPRFAKNLQEDKELEMQSNSQYREFVQQQVRTINRYDIVAAALDSLGKKRKLYWQLPAESDRRSVERLQVALAVRPVPDTYLITISLSGDKKEGLAEVVNAVVDSYLAVAQKEEFYGADRRVELLRKQRGEILGEVKRKTDRRAEIGRSLGMTSFSAGSSSNAFDKLLQNAREALDEAVRRRFQAEAKLLAVDAGARTSGPAEEVPAAETGRALGDTDPPEVVEPDAEAHLEALAWSMVGMDAELGALKAGLTKRKTDLLIAASGLTADHPGRKAAEREAREIDTELALRSKEVFARARRAILGQRRAEAFEAEMAEKELRSQVAARRQEATAYAALYDEALAITADLERLRKRLDSIEDRVDFLALESQAPGFARLTSRALPPDLPSGGGKKKLLLMVLGAALGLAAVLPIAFDLLDPRLHSANDAEKLLGFPPLGWLVERSDEATRTFGEEQLRRLADRLARDAREHGSRTFAFTSAKPGEGVTSLVLDLARVLTALGVPALAVEANAFRPSPRYGDGPGLAGLLEGRADPSDAVVPAADGLPDRVPAGAAGSGHLPALVRLPRVLASLPAAYEVLLLDVAPVLFSADAEALLRDASVCVLVIEAQATTKAVLKRTARTLEGITPNAFAAIVTRVRVYEGGGYFQEMLGEFLGKKRAETSVLASPWLWR